VTAPPPTELVEVKNMLKSKVTSTLGVVVLIMVIFYPATVLADVLVYCLDTSGSMKKNGKFDAAKTVLIQGIEAARPGDVVYVIAFDTNDYPLGRVDVGEDGSEEVKAKLIAKIRGLKAQGLYTNLDEPLQAAKALLLEERTPGARKIIILSDGLSDPSPDHTRIDIPGIGEMIPQELGWAVYLVGLPDDIAGLFQTPLKNEEIVLAPKNPHIQGIAIEQFSPEKLKKAVEAAKEDVTASMPPPAPATPSAPVQVTLAPLTPDLSSLEALEPKTTEKPPQVTPSSSPQPSNVERFLTLKAAVELPPLLSFPLLWPLVAAGLVVIGVFSPLLLRLFLDQNGHTHTGRPRFNSVTLEVKEGGELKRFPLTLHEGEKKGIGPQGDIPLATPELPPIVFTLLWKNGQLWLTPQDRIIVNNHPVTTKTPVGLGDLICVRDTIKITIHEGGNNR